jgi:arabinose-5-phosphate isomerase
MSGADPLAVGRRVLRTEAEALARLADGLDRSFVSAVDLLFAASGRVVATGIGKSGHVARKIAATLASTGTAAIFVHPAEASHGDLGMIGPGDLILALSKTGETRELADIIAHAKRFAIPLVAITAAPDSALGRAAEVVLTLPNTPEAADALNAPTTSTTLQMALGDALAVTLLERRGFKPSDFPLVGRDTPMREALLVMSEKRWGIVGVIDDHSRLIGAITDGDLRRHIEGLFEHVAGEVMTLGPRKTAPPTMLAAEALALMSDPAPAVTVLFVVEDALPVGILHVHDLLRAGVM